MAAFAAAALLLATPSRAQDEDPQPVSTRTGVFTTEQADRGLELFEVRCGECHQPADFQETFLESWSGQTADALFRDIRNTMPEDSPGSLKGSEYAAVIAFLLRLNGLPEGAEALPASTRRLKLVLIESPQPDSTGGLP